MKFNLENCKQKYIDFLKSNRLKDKANAMSIINNDIENQCKSSFIYNSHDIEYVKEWLLSLEFKVIHWTNPENVYLEVYGWAEE